MRLLDQMRKCIAASVRHADATMDQTIVTQLMARRGAGLQPALVSARIATPTPSPSQEKDGPSYWRDSSLLRVARESSRFRVLASASTQTFFSAVILL